MPPPRPQPKQDAETVITIVVDGATYALRTNELSALDTQALRRETGQSVRALLQMAQDDPDLDVIAGLVWLARRQAGDAVAWADVAATISYAAELNLGEGGEPDPESESAGG